MKDKLVLQGKLEIKNAHIVIDGIDLANVLEHGSSVFMVVEPLPESKPEKNCGNCGAGHTGCKTEPGKTYCSAWQPKAAEPQGWEQRFDTFWKSYADKEDVLYTWNNCQRRKDELLSFIRAEIERAKDEEKKDILHMLGGVRALAFSHEIMAIEENRHRTVNK